MNTNEEVKDITAAESAENAAESEKEITMTDNKAESKKPAEGAQDVYVHKFAEPFTYEGKKYVSLNFYFKRLTGNDMIAVENEMLANSEYAIDPLMSRNFQSKLASRASGVGSDVIAALPIREFNIITNAVRNFLIDLGY